MLSPRRFLLPLLLLTTTLASAQPGRLRFTRLSLEEGLSQSTVTCVFQDSRGYMWFGTRNGLDLYDGDRFRHFRHDLEDKFSLPDNRVTAVAEDFGGDLWIGTRDGLARLTYKDSRTRIFITYRHSETNPDTPIGNHVRALLRDRSGYIWVGTTEGLSRLDPQKNTYEHFFRNDNAELGLSHDNISALCEDRRGRLWIGTTGGGLNFLNGARTEVRTFLNWDRREALRYPEAVETLLPDLPGKYGPLAAVGGGGSMPDTTTLSLDAPRRLLVTATGEGRGSFSDYGEITRSGRTFWQMDQAGARHAGGHIKNRIQVDVVDFPAGDYQLTWRANQTHGPGNWSGQAPDRAELWGLGVFELDAETMEDVLSAVDDYVIPSQIAGNFVSSIYEDSQERLWIGTEGRGVSSLDASRERFLNLDREEGTGGVVYAPALLAQLDTLVRGREPLAAITEAEDNADESRELLVDDSFTALVVYQGEQRGNLLVDVGWLSRDGKPVWQPLPELTTHAGGFRENRLQVALFTLLPGTYRLHWRSDALYGTGRWGGNPPPRPEWWGIQLLALSESEAEVFGETLTRLERPRELATNQVTAVSQDSDGFLWIGTQDGLSRLDPRNLAVENYRASAVEPESLSADHITSLITDRSGMLWIGTNTGGVNRYHPLNNRFPKYVRNPLLASAYSLQLDSEPASQPAANTLLQVPVTSFYEDAAGRLYIGTGEGMTVLDRTGDRFMSVSYHQELFRRLQESLITVMLEDRDGYLWVGTETRGLFRTMARQPVPVDTVLFNNDPQQNGQPTLLERYTMRLDDSWALASNHITAILEDQSGRVWIGTTFGLHQFEYDPDLEEGGFARYLPERQNPGSLGDSQITALAEDRGGGLWVGTATGGVDRYDQATMRFEHFRNQVDQPQSLSVNAVTCLLTDDDGRLWVGTNGGGLNRFNGRDFGFSRFSERDGLPDNTVLAMLDDGGGGLWTSSGNGLARLDKTTGTIRRFGESDGLQSREFSTGAALRLRDGYLAFGGAEGFNLFDPGNTLREAGPPKVVLTAVKKFNEQLVFDRPLDEVTKVELPYGENYVSFEFLALDYTNPEATIYAYRLVNLDPDWVESGTRRFASYPDLDPGDYTFQVKAAGSDEVWNEDVVSIQLVITPPFYYRVWFIVSVVAALVGLVLLIYRLRVNQLRREKRLQEEFAKRLIQSQEHERRRIATELHDSLSQNLLVINNEIQHQIQVADREARDHHLDGLSDMILDSINEVRHIAYHLHPHQLERLGLKRAVESVINKIEEIMDIDFVLRNADIDGVFSKDVEINIYRIIQEAVNNVIKHAGANEVLVELRKSERYVTIRIEDDGKGFDTKILSSGNTGIGLTGMNERVKLIGGALRIRSAPNEGTTLDIRIPIPEIDPPA